MMASASCSGQRPPGDPGRPADTGSLVGGQVFVLDRVRIEVALEGRQRYKYVHPRVLREGAGWKVVSPNCSRNVDRDGGEIDIAWLVPTQAPDSGVPGSWLLHARDHIQKTWVLKLRAPTLAEALDRLVQDEQREFWV
jgi:hypothetical protein